MKPLPEIDALAIYEELQEELISLLWDLDSQEWEVQTWNADWQVRDVVAHLLDGDLRRLSLHRDGMAPPQPKQAVTDHASLVDFLSDLNKTWIEASKRLSANVLLQLTEFVHPKVIDFFKKLDPEGTAQFPVSWAGEQTSTNRFDIAREYTEKWYHQQQIREAVNRPLLTQEQWLHPLLHTLIKAVPAVYEKHASDKKESKILIRITGKFSYTWLLTEKNGRWQLFQPEGETPDTSIRMEADTAWRLFSKNISEEEALKKTDVTGDHSLGAIISKTTSYMK